MNTYTKLFSLMFFLLLAKYGFSQIQFYDFLPDTVTTVYENGSSDTANFSIDINGDSINDISFRLAYQYNFISPHSTANFFVTVNSINGNNQFGSSDPNVVCFIEGFMAGDTIDNNISWDPIYNYLLFSHNDLLFYCSNFYSHRYLAFTDMRNGECFYGWILLKTQTYYGQDYGTAKVYLDVKEFAYNTDAEHGIVAGDTISSIYPTSISNLSLKAKPILYPNPTSGKFYIKNAEHDKIDIRNIMGEVVLETRNNEIDISEYPNGLYFVHIYFGGTFITRKIIKY